MDLLTLTRFDQSVLNMALVHLCDRQSHVGMEMRRLYASQQEETDEAVYNPWFHLHQFRIYIPHPDQQYEQISLEEGLTKGYNVEVESVRERNTVPYEVPEGGQFVVVLKQKGLDDSFEVKGVGIFVRSLGVLSLDMVLDSEKGEYQPLLVKHPVIRSYPTGWENKLFSYLQRDMQYEDLPNIAGHVDRDLNQDYRPPSWKELYLSATGFKGF